MVYLVRDILVSTLFTADFLSILDGYWILAAIQCTKALSSVALFWLVVSGDLRNNVMSDAIYLVVVIGMIISAGGGSLDLRDGLLILLASNSIYMFYALGAAIRRSRLWCAI